MSAPRFSDWFWPLIESFHNDEALMVATFQEMSKQRLVAFYRQFRIAQGTVNPQFWSDVDEQFTSEDGNKDFAAWVVTRGRDYWNLVRKYHFMLKKRFDEFNKSDGGFVEPQHIADRVFYERFKSEILALAFPD